MDNNGVIQIGTLSTCQSFETDKKKKLTNNTKEKVKTKLKVKVPGVYDQSLWRYSTRKFKSPEKIETTIFDSSTTMHRDISADVDLYSGKEVKQNLQDIKNAQTVNLTSNLENRFQMRDPGKLVLSSELHETALSADKKASTTFSKKEDLTADFETTTKARSLLQNISSLNLVDIKSSSSNISQVTLTNTYEMTESGIIDISTKKSENSAKTGAISETIREKTLSESKHNVVGNYELRAEKESFRALNGTTVELNNLFVQKAENTTDSQLQTRLSELKRINSSPVIDSQYSNIINTATSTANIQIVDNIVKKECINNMNAKSGLTEIRVTSKQSGMHCVIRMDAQGQMTIDTTDKLTITTTNAVDVKTTSTTITSPTVMIKGNTTIDGTLHVTGQTTIDPDATIGKKSFLGHMHIGNMGSLTSPPM